MNKDNAKDFLPLVQALADGKVIQVKFFDRWADLEVAHFDMDADMYRIKPEPREFFIIRYKDGSENGPFCDKEEAEGFALHDDEYSIVRYREVIE